MTTNDENLISGYYKILNDATVSGMSFVALAEAMATTDKKSPLYLVLDREHKKILAKDQAKITRSNVIIGAIIGGAFGLCGVILGYHLKSSPSSQQPAPSSSVHQVQPSQLNVNKPIGSASFPEPISSKPVPMPHKVQPDSKDSKP